MNPAAGALLADTRRRPGRILLTGLAIAVATTFAAGTLLLSETLRGQVAATAQDTPAAAAVVVRGPDVDEAAVRAVTGVADAVALRELYAPVGATLWEMTLWEMTLWEVTSDPMTGPLSRLGPPVSGRLPATPDEVLTGAGTAERTGIGPGTVLTVGTRSVTVTGIVDVPWDQVDELIGPPALVADLGGELEQVDVLAAPGVDAQELAGRVAAATGATVRTGDEQRLAEVRDASASVTAVLVGVGVFAGLALVAASVVVASTFRIVLTQRRTQLALLRCIGAGRRQLVGAVLAEAAVSGLVAGLLGAGAAVAAGYGVLGAVALAGAPVPVLVVPLPGLVACVAMAVLATVLSALAPALAAARIPPVAALGTAADGESGAPRTGPRLVLAGVLVAVAAAPAVLAQSLDAEVALIVLAASGMVVFAAIVAAGPLLVRVIAASAGRAVTALGGAAGRLAVANAVAVPRRTAATVSVLALGVGLTSALLVGLASTEADAEQSLAAQFPSDIVVHDTALAARLDAAPELVVVGADDVSIHVDAAPGVADAAARDAVGAALTGRIGVLVEYAGDARAELESVLLTLRVVGLGLVGMTLLVAVVGVAVTLLLSVTERTRETGLLRAVGLTRAGVRRMVAWEAVLAGTGAGVLGAGIGSLYGVLGLQALDVGAGFVAATFPTLAALVAGVVAVAALAAVAPAVRAGRVPPVRALLDA